MATGMRLLFLDIETAPHVVYVWRLFDDHVPIDRVISPGYTLCWSAKWYGEREVMFDSIKQSGKERMLKRIHKLMTEADAICHYNGVRFDLPVLQQEFLQLGMKPPAPAKQIDLYQTVSRHFRFASNKLDFVAQSLKLGSKVAHKGMELWKGCMAGNSDDWAVMEKYNRQDVRLLEPLYERVRPWMTSHPNAALYIDSKKPICPFCGGTNLQRRGVGRTTVFVYPRFQCKADGCGKWSRGRNNLMSKERRESVLLPAAG